MDDLLILGLIGILLAILLGVFVAVFWTLLGLLADETTEV